MRETLREWERSETERERERRERERERKRERETEREREWERERESVCVVQHRCSLGGALYKDFSRLGKFFSLLKIIWTFVVLKNYIFYKKGDFWNFSLFEFCNNIDVQNVFDHIMFFSLKLPIGYLHCYMEIVHTIMFHCDKCSNSVLDKLINTLQI